MEKDPSEQTVAEFLFTQCSKSLLSELAADSGYWSSCEKFVLENTHRVVGELSFKQRDLLIKIKDGLVEKAKDN
jgi:hypothetical protein